ncbi:hypothetical protein [Maribacter sp. 2-571]|uniref:hypothetical protein n=1 Tax=Maribacter sp. 2-571 TaxID=3417569 RepID=UPI003D32F63B
MKYIIVLIVFAAFGCIGYGFSIKETAELLSNRFIGSGVVLLFLVAMPLFLIKESKGKKMKDYMLNEENILKMNKREKEKSKRQGLKSKK